MTNWDESRNGWSYCASDCPEEEKVCKACQTNWMYKGELFEECTDIDSIFFNNVTGMYWKWCVTDLKQFYSSNRIIGWKYCSNNCPIASNDYVIYVTVFGVLILVVLMSVILRRIYFKLRKMKKSQTEESIQSDDMGHKDNLREPETIHQHPKIIFKHNPTKMNWNHGHRLTTSEQKQENTIRLLRQLSGDPDIFDPKSDVKGQEKSFLITQNEKSTDLILQLMK